MRIGLTGSMAAGKSTVSEQLASLGLFIIDADRIAHEVLDLPEVKLRLMQTFGEKILSPNLQIDRRALARAAFSSGEATEKLNGIVHPQTFALMLDRAKRAEDEGCEHVVFDVPLLFESGFNKYCDKVISVIADDELRYSRIMLRDGLTREEAALRIEKQMPQAQKAALSDAVIVNNESMEALSAEIAEALCAIGVKLPPVQVELDNYLPDILDE